MSLSDYKKQQGYLAEYSQIINKAVKLDNNKEYQEAIKFYQQALDFSSNIWKFPKDYRTVVANKNSEIQKRICQLTPAVSNHDAKIQQPQQNSNATSTKQPYSQVNNAPIEIQSAYTNIQSIPPFSNSYRNPPSYHQQNPEKYRRSSSLMLEGTTVQNNNERNNQYPPSSFYPVQNTNNNQQSLYRVQTPMSQAPSYPPIQSSNFSSHEQIIPQTLAYPTMNNQYPYQQPNFVPHFNSTPMCPQNPIMSSTNPQNQHPVDPIQNKPVPVVQSNIKIIYPQSQPMSNQQNQNIESSQQPSNQQPLTQPNNQNLNLESHQHENINIVYPKVELPVSQLNQPSNQNEQNLPDNKPQPSNQNEQNLPDNKPQPSNQNETNQPGVNHNQPANQQETLQQNEVHKQEIQKQPNNQDQISVSIQKLDSNEPSNQQQINSHEQHLNQNDQSSEKTEIVSKPKKHLSNFFTRLFSFKPSKKHALHRSNSMNDFYVNKPKESEKPPAQKAPPKPKIITDEPPKAKIIHSEPPKAQIIDSEPPKAKIIDSEPKSQVALPPTHYEPPHLLSDIIVQLSDYKIGRCLGSGSFGVVYQCIEKSTGNEYALKQITKPISSQFTEKQLLREIEIMNLARHPLTCHIHGFSLAQRTPAQMPFIVTDYCPNGSLNLVVIKQKKFNHTQKLIALYGIADAMRYLHSINIVHRDLKPENVLFNVRNEPVVCDFGLSKLMDTPTLRQTMASGSPVYMAPELMKREDYTKLIDVYSYGFLTYEVLAERPAFETIKNIQILVNIVCEGKRPDLSSIDEYQMPKCFKDLISHAWSESVSDRPTFDEIVEFFREGKLTLPDANMDDFNRFVASLSSARF